MAALRHFWPSCQAPPEVCVGQMFHMLHKHLLREECVAAGSSRDVGTVILHNLAVISSDHLLGNVEASC